MVILVAAAGRLAATSESHALSDAGSVAAIVAGTVAVLLLAWGVGRWLLRTYRADDIAHGLHIEQPKMRLELQVDGADMYVGLDVRNGIARPLTYKARVFRVRLGGDVHEISERDRRENMLGPGQPRAWFRDPVHIRRIDLPQQLEVEYELAYGSAPGKMRRAIKGSYRMTLQQAHLSIGAREGLWEVIRPEADSKLKRSGR
jgi:hypothetical protein